MPVLPSYGNQSIDLLCKSIDWFLYEGTLELNGLICYWELRIIKNFEDSVVRILICFRVILELKTPFLIGISNVSQEYILYQAQC